jgi:hypothetical protein
MANVASAPKRSPQPQPKTLDADDASSLARLAYRVVLQADIDKEKALNQLRTPTAKQVGKAVLGYGRVNSDAVEMAERLKSWARKNAKVEVTAEAE